MLLQVHQVDVNVREAPLWDRDVQWLGPDVAMDPALLTVQAGLGPDCYVLGEAAPDIPSRDKTPRGEPARL